MLKLMALALAFVAAQSVPVQADADAKEKRKRSSLSTKPETPSGGRDYDEGSGVYFKNCAAARAAGAAPVRRGDAGYARHLDRDNDGMGCE